jgi:hypothetical protein
MHRPERLRAAVAHVRAHAIALPLASLLSFLPLLTALLAAQFRLICHNLACRFLASKMLEPARECLLVKSKLTAVFGLRNAAALPRLDVNRPPLASGLVLEMFWTHRRFSTAAENPKWNENTLSESRARTGRLQTNRGWQGKRPAVGPAYVVGRAGGFGHASNGHCWRRPYFLKGNQGCERHRPVAQGGFAP